MHGGSDLCLELELAPLRDAEQDGMPLGPMTICVISFWYVLKSTLDLRKVHVAKKEQCCKAVCISGEASCKWLYLLSSPLEYEPLRPRYNTSPHPLHQCYSGTL